MIDFTQLLKDLNIDQQNIVNGWVQVNCPYHDNGDRGFKGGFNIQGEYYHCWVCGGHSLLNVLHDITDLSFYELRKLIEQYSNTSISRIKKEKVKSLVKEIKLPTNELNERCRKYLLNRNFDPEFLFTKYNIVGNTLTGEWAGRLIIPIICNNKIVSFQGRSLHGKKYCKEHNILRYKTLNKKNSIIDPKTILYNLDNCKEDYLILVEGAPDCWRFGDNCAATLGTSVTNEQILLIIKRFKIVFIVFDPEEEAQERAKKLSILLQNTKVYIVNTELNYDPGDMNNNEINKVKKKIINLVRMLRG